MPESVIFSYLLCQNLFPCFLTFCSSERSIPTHFLLFIVLRVEFDQRFFNGSEVSGYISITLSLRGGTSIDNITVTVIPYDRPPHVSSAEGKKIVTYILTGEF